jgi:O-antigen/teichoic acid export membrane protein
MRSHEILKSLLRVGFGSQLRRNTLAGSASAIVGASISALSYPVYLHFLGYEQYGLWLSVGVVLSFAQFGNLGLAPAVASTVAIEFAQRDFDGMKATVSTALIALSAAGVVCVVAVLSAGRFVIGTMHLSTPLTSEARDLLPLVALVSLYAIQIDTVNAVLVGIGRLDLSVGTQVASRALALIVSAILLSRGFGVISIPIGILSGYVFLHFTALALARHLTGHSCLSVHSLSFRKLRKLVRFGSGLLLCMIISFLLGPLNEFTLTRYSGPGSVPIYDLAFSVCMQLRGILESGFRSLTPEVSRLGASELPDIADRLRGVSRRAMTLIAAVGLPVYTLLFVLAEPCLRIWLQGRFQPALVPTLRVLLAASFVSLCGVPGYYMLIGRFKVKHIVTSWVLQSGTNLGVLAALAALTGTMSAFMTATAAAAGIAAGGTYLLVRGRMEISSMRIVPALCVAP